MVHEKQGRNLMRIRVGTLKRILREVALSPAVFKDNQPVRDPMDRPNIARAIASLEQPFRSGVELNLVLEARDSYDEQARELDDDEYGRIKEVADKATEMVMARVHRAVQGTWAEAMKGVEGVEKPATPANKVAA
jgi:hypothetical protein